MRYVAPVILAPLRSRNVLLLTCAIASTYSLLQIFILNENLITTTLTGSFSLIYKLTLLSQLINAYFSMFPIDQVLLNMGMALLIGLNITLLLAQGQRVKNSGSKRFSVGGVGLFALVSSGCPSCSLTLFSLLGPSYGILGVFFHSLAVQLSILTILSFSIIYSLKQLEKSASCNILSVPSKK